VRTRRYGETLGIEKGKDRSPNAMQAERRWAGSKRRTKGSGMARKVYEGGSHEPAEFQGVGGPDPAFENLKKSSAREGFSGESANHQGEQPGSKPVAAACGGRDKGAENRRHQGQQRLWAHQLQAKGQTRYQVRKGAAAGRSHLQGSRTPLDERKLKNMRNPGWANITPWQNEKR